MTSGNEGPGADPSTGGGTTTMTLHKVRMILDCFLPANGPLTLSDIQRRTGLPTTTVFRLLQSMVTEGFLANDDGYRLSWRMGKWITAIYDEGLLLRSATPYLAGLRDETHETASMFVREGFERVCVAVSLGPQAVNMQTRVGNVLPLQAGASSKILLAWDAAARGRLRGRGLVRYTANTVTDIARYEAELDDVRDAGYALSHAEMSDGVVSISAPVFDPFGQIAAAVNLGIPIQRATDEYVQERIEPVRACAALITEACGSRISRPGGDDASADLDRRVYQR
jgi:DNA-binding IclR family transcriptional regulator